MNLSVDSLLTWSLDDLVKALTDDSLEVVAISDGSTTVHAGSSDDLALRWAKRYLAPAMTVAACNPGEPATYLHVTVDAPTLSTLFSMLPAGESVSLQMRRIGDRTDGPRDRIVVRDIAGPVLYVIDRAVPRVLAIAAASATNVRDLARQVRELVLSDALRSGWIVMHGSAVAQDGRATVFLGNKGAGKSTLALEAAERRGCAYISNDRVLLKATDRGILVRPYPMSVRLGGGTIRNSAALRSHLHAYDHLQAALLPLEEQFAHTDKLELCLCELTEILGCSIEQEAILDRLVLPHLDVGKIPAPVRVSDAGSERAAVLAEALFTPDPDGNGWLRDLLYGEHPANDQTYAAVYAEGAIFIQGSAPDIVERLFPEGSASGTVRPRTWQRDDQIAKLVCVMDHRRVDRGLELAAWKTRAVQGGSVHEILFTSDFEHGDRADEVHYLGFAAFEPGLLCVGDELIVGADRLGTIVGFDDTHLPNHMNIVIASDVRATGVELGVSVGDVVRFRPSVSV